MTKVILKKIYQWIFEMVHRIELNIKKDYIMIEFSETKLDKIKSIEGKEIILGIRPEHISISNGNKIIQ